MQANKYYSLTLAVMAGITIMSSHTYKWHIAIGILVVAVMWMDNMLFGEVKE